MRRPILLGLLTLIISSAATNAQAPSGTIVQTTGPAPMTAAVPVGSVGGAERDAASKALLIQALQQLKTSNDAILKRQMATLQQLDEIEKAANEIKIHAKRS